MSRPLPGVVALALAATIGSLHAQPSTDRRPVAALLVSVVGRVTRQPAAGARARPLAMKAGASHEPLKVGERLVCDSGSSFDVVTADGMPRHVGGAECNGKSVYVVKFVQGPLADALEEYSRSTGRTRGQQAGDLVWPSDDVRMRPATAARIEWRRQPSGTGTITARRPTTGVVLWTSRPFDARSGKETFPALEGALREAASRGECPVSVELQLGGARRSTVSFTIVGRDAEARIDRRLKEIGAVVAGDVRGLLSGGILEQQGLLREALDEYAAVWRRSPSEFLRSKVQALAEVLNDPRLGEFEGRTNGPVARE